MSKITPGPWSDERFERDIWRNGDHDTEPLPFTSVLMDEGNENDGANCAEVHGPNQKANARAIAALPDLIEALKRIEEFETNNYEIEPPGDIARAALKKAGIK